MKKESKPSNTVQIDSIDTNKDNEIKSDPFQVVQSACLYPNIQELKTKIKILDTHINLKWLLSHFEADIRYNLMTRKREIYFPKHSLFADDVENSAIHHVNFLATMNMMPLKQLDNHLDMIAFESPYHPIVQCITDKPWDGVPRLTDFIRTIEAENMELAHHLIRTWMVAAIAAAHSVTGFTNHGVLVLQGAQGMGKTEWVKKLDPINCGAVKESAFLDPTNKDSISQLAMYWIAELGELEAIFKKSEIGRLKSFVTMESDFVRLPYARKPTRLARRTAYIATVNESNFLSDDTGNRRWWTVPVTHIDYAHGMDMQQVWAEVYAEWKHGALAYLPSELQKQVNTANEEHEKIDPFKEKFLVFYDWRNPARRWMTASAVLEEMNFKNHNRADSTRMGTIITNVNNCPGRRSHGITLHEIPFLRNSRHFVEN